MPELTTRSQRVLESAGEEARRRGHEYVGTEHLLLALLADTDGVAGRVCGDLGVTTEIVQAVEGVLASDGYRGRSNYQA